MQIEVGKPHVERIVALRIELDLAVECELAKQRDAGADAKPPDVPLIVIPLVRIDRGELVVESPAQQDTLHDRIRIVHVPFRELPPDRVVSRRFFGGGRLSGCRGGQRQHKHQHKEA